MSMIMMLNLKGGVAKTTNAVAIAECFASMGRKVLLIDADHQCMASELLLGVDGLEKLDKRKRTFYDLLTEMLKENFHRDKFSFYPISNVSKISSIKEYMNCVPCSYRLDDLEDNMRKARRDEPTNQEFLRKWNRWRKIFADWCHRHYDYTIFDCPPNINITIKFLLGSADYYIIPSIPDKLSIRGSHYLLSRLEKRGYTKIHGLGTLWCKVRKQVEEHLKTIEDFKGKNNSLPLPFLEYINESAAMIHAVELEEEVSSFRKKYGQDMGKRFENLCLEIEERIKKV